MNKDNLFLQIGKNIEKNRKKKEQRTIIDLAKEKKSALNGWQEFLDGNFTMVFIIICVFVAVLLTRAYYNHPSLFESEDRQMIKIMFYAFTVGMASILILFNIIGAFLKRKLKYELNILNKGRKK
jgi:uncharacterized membrane protein